MMLAWWLWFEGVTVQVRNFFGIMTVVMMMMVVLL